MTSKVLSAPRRLTARPTLNTYDSCRRLCKKEWPRITRIARKQQRQRKERATGTRASARQQASSGACEDLAAWTAEPSTSNAQLPTFNQRSPAEPIEKALKEKVQGRYIRGRPRYCVVGTASSYVGERRGELSTLRRSSGQ